MVDSKARSLKLHDWIRIIRYEVNDTIQRRRNRITVVVSDAIGRELRKPNAVERALGTSVINLYMLPWRTWCKLGRWTGPLYSERQDPNVNDGRPVLAVQSMFRAKGSSDEMVRCEISWISEGFPETKSV